MTDSGTAASSALVDPLRVGLVGFGLAGSAFHAPLIDALAEFELAVVVTADSKRAVAVAEKYRRTTVAEDLDVMLAAKVDVAVVATPNATHSAIAHRLLDEGVPVVVDKPLATSSSQARDLIEKATRLEVPLTCYQNRRWDGDFLTAKALIGAGELGDVIAMESRFERWRPVVAPTWKEQPAPGGGVLFDLGPHLIDQAIQLFGPPSSVYSELRTVRRGAQVPDSAFLALTHPRGITSHLSISVVAAAPGPRFRILGDQGAYVKRGMDPQERELRAGAVPGGEGWGQEPPHFWGEIWQGDESSPVATQPGDYLQFYRLLGAALRGQGPLPVDPQDCLVALEVIEQAMAGDSAKIG